jgi:large subunit ribosomal protein L31
MLPERQDASGSNESREASEGTVKEGIHPYFNSTLVTCNTCNTKFETYSTSADLKVEICSACHPFYTGKVRALSQTGQVEKFRQRYTKAK